MTRFVFAFSSSKSGHAPHALDVSSADRSKKVDIDDDYQSRVAYNGSKYQIWLFKLSYPLPYCRGPSLIVTENSSSPTDHVTSRLTSGGRLGNNYSDLVFSLTSTCSHRRPKSLNARASCSRSESGFPKCAHLEKPFF